MDPNLPDDDAAARILLELRNPPPPAAAAAQEPAEEPVAAQEAQAPVHFHEGINIPALYRPLDQYMAKCAHVGCNIGIADDRGYCCEGHLNLASIPSTFAFHYIGGFQCLQDIQRFCVVSLFNKRRGLQIGIPNLVSGNIFCTLPWEQEEIFRTTIGDCAWLFFTKPPAQYTMIGATRLKWNMKARKEIKLFGEKDIFPVYFTPLNLRTYGANAELVEMSRLWYFYLFQSGEESLYCLTRSTGQKLEEPKVESFTSNKKPPKPPTAGPKPEDSASTSSGIQPGSSTAKRAKTTSGARASTEEQSAADQILTNFLSSIMIHATRPFVLNEWIQTKIGGYEVSGTVENIVADMRKVLSKNPQIEQQKIHRRVFLEDTDPENQALRILISCFLKTSRFEEYLCVKEAVLLDLLRVIRHHEARLATPIRTVQRMRNEAEVDSAAFSDIVFNQAAMNRRFMLIEPSYKINSDDNSKSSSPNSVQKSEENYIQGEPSETKAETENNGSVSVSNAKKEKPKVALGSNSSTSTKGSPTSTSDQPVEQMSEEKKKESVGDANKAEKDEVSDGEGATEQTLKSKARQGTEKNIGDQKSRDGGGSGTSSSLEENIVLGVALDGSKRTLPIDEELEASGALMESEELGIGSE